MNSAIKEKLRVYNNRDGSENTKLSAQEARLKRGLSVSFPLNEILEKAKPIFSDRT